MVHTAGVFIFVGSKARRAAVCRSACQETGVWVSSAGSTPGGVKSHGKPQPWPSCSMLQSLKNLATKIGRPHKRHHADLSSDLCLGPRPSEGLKNLLHIVADHNCHKVSQK